jgi:MoxR-like ATPase
MSSTGPQEEFDRLVQEVVDRPPQSSTRARPLEEWLEERLGLSSRQVWVKQVSKFGNLDVRASEPGSKRQAKLFVVLITSAGELEKYVDYGQQMVGPGGSYESFAIIVKGAQGLWTIPTVVERPGGTLAQRLRDGTFPDLVVATSSNRGPGAHAPASSAIQMVVDPRVERMVRVAIASASAVLLVGPPGTGKTLLLRNLIERIKRDPESFGFSRPPSEKWVTPEESWTTRELVGGQTVDETSRLRFRPGHVLNAISNDQWLILDEANRADMDKIFGGLLTWLSNQAVELEAVSTAVDAPMVTLGWSNTPESRTEGKEFLDADGFAAGETVQFLAGTEWRLLGTYNALDAQRVFRFGQALGRRFIRVPIPPMSAHDFGRALERYPELPDGMRDDLAGLYEAHLAHPNTVLGPALFFRMHDYIRAGLRLGALMDVESSTGETVPPGDDTSSPARPVSSKTLVTEAYLTSAGTWLAKLESSDLEALRGRVVPGILPKDEWEWMEKLLTALG